MSKVDLHLIGNSVVDQIFEVERSEPSTGGFIPGSSNRYLSSRTCYGGLGNLLYVLKKSGLSVHVSTHIGKDLAGEKLKDYFARNNIPSTLYPIKETSSALILSETFHENVKEKTSFVKWGNVDTFRNFKPLKATWVHISYLDILHKLDLSKLKKNYDYISADLCLNAPKKFVVKKMLKNLKHLDFLFISTNEARTYTELVQREFSFEISDFLTKLLRQEKSDTRIILHSPYFCVICDRHEDPLKADYAKPKENVSVVGAGDKFCASFISYLLTSMKGPNSKYYLHNGEIRRTALAMAISEAHNQTVKILEKNEEI